MRSTLTCSNPASRAQRTASGTRAGSWVRSSVASTCGTADWTPNEMRVKPPSRSSASESGVTLSGFASVVTSALGNEAEGRAQRVEHPDEVGRRQLGRRAAAEEHRLDRRQVTVAASVRAASSISAIAVSAYDARVAPSPSSSAV